MVGVENKNSATWRGFFVESFATWARVASTNSALKSLSRNGESVIEWTGDHPSLLGTKQTDEVYSGEVRYFISFHTNCVRFHWRMVLTISSPRFKLTYSNFLTFETYLRRRRSMKLEVIITETNRRDVFCWFSGKFRVLSYLSSVSTREIVRVVCFVNSSLLELCIYC